MALATQIGQRFGNDTLSFCDHSRSGQFGHQSEFLGMNYLGKLAK